MQVVLMSSIRILVIQDNSVLVDGSDEMVSSAIDCGREWMSQTRSPNLGCNGVEKEFGRLRGHFKEERSVMLYFDMLGSQEV
jgi:hypothetical protein